MAVSKGPSSSEEKFIEKVVVAFYRKATTDFIIGYHFRKIATAENHSDPLKPPIEAFSHHLPRINDFWKNQLLGLSLPKGSQPFQLIQIHKALSVRKGEVGRWILLFEETLREFDDQNPELARKWQEKLLFFKDTFLESKILFR